jgi:hypothetical protein
LSPLLKNPRKAHSPDRIVVEEVSGLDLNFVWTGSGSMGPGIRAVIDRIGAVREIHSIDRISKVRDYFDAADMFVLPSVCFGAGPTVAVGGSQ